MMDTNFIVDSVFEVPVRGSVVFIREESDFVNPFDDGVVGELVADIKNWGRVLTNGECVRVNSVTVNNDCIFVGISKGNFYDFVSTNLLVMGGNRPFSSDVNAMVASWKKLSSWEEVIGEKSLANVSTVSVLIEDELGNVAVIDRTDKVAVNSRYFGTTVTGTPDGSDFLKQDPFKSCVIRECNEEIGLVLSEGDISFMGLVIGKEKLQPVMLYKAKIKGSWQDYVDEIVSAKDFNFEIKKMHILNENNLFSSIPAFNYTVIARYHIAKFFRII